MDKNAETVEIALMNKPGDVKGVRHEKRHGQDGAGLGRLIVGAHSFIFVMNTNDGARSWLRQLPCGWTMKPTKRLSEPPKPNGARLPT
jgi:hypothetical protein